MVAVLGALDPPTADLTVLFRRDELLMVDVGGLVLSLALTSLKSEWIPGLTAAVRQAHETAGAPVPIVAVHRLDKRYPLQVGFDSNLGDLRRALAELRPAMRAVAVVTEFDGFLGATMRAALAAIGAVSRGKPPIAPHRSVAQALGWLEPHLPPDQLGPEARARQFASLQAMGEELGSYPVAEAPRRATNTRI
jgi:hypothetical protein